jgi:High potential iron-sulfur protein
MNKQRRIFILASSAVGLGFTALGAHAQDAKAPPLLAETDPQASALGYVADATKADKKKYAQYAAGQDCLTCQLYQGKPKEAAGGCPLFAGKNVTAKGWCSAWVKKAA